tara:strand:+ start:233 stop:445 length:213 start_codon:yes stop_codon:yes gene_type:complete
MTDLPPPLLTWPEAVPGFGEEPLLFTAHLNNLIGEKLDSSLCPKEKISYPHPHRNPIQKLFSRLSGRSRK